MKRRILATISIIVVMLFFLSNIPTITYAMEAASSPIYHGIDVSTYQGDINFDLVKQAGIQIVYIKATEGKTLIDPKFRRNYEEAKKQGMKIGFYHFVRARNEQEAIQEAEFFANTIAGTTPNCRLAMDFEIFGDLSKEEINQISLAFLQKLHELTQKEVIVYSNANDARTIFTEEISKNYPLWIAQYGVNKPSDVGTWNVWIGYQYTDRGRINGISSFVDRDYFTKEILLNDESSIETSTNPPNLEETIYIVERGDTLWSIAKRYGTTVETLVNKNNISNPNLIYIGERLQITKEESSQNQYYVVKRGDTLWKIARTYHTTVQKLVNDNQIKKPNLIYPGQRIWIGRSNNNSSTNSSGIARYYRVRRTDSLWKIAKYFGTTVRSLVMLNNIQNPNLIYPGQVLKIFP